MKYSHSRSRTLARIPYSDWMTSSVTAGVTELCLPRKAMTATGEIGVPGDYDLHCRATHDAPGLRHGRRTRPA